MNTPAEIIFWLSVAALVYTYAGYPLLLFLVSTLRSLNVQRGDYQPTLSFIITAYNEERDLAAKLDNTLALDYPPELIEITVAQARGEIILFSDATSLYQPNTLRALMPNFSDPTVGCVAGRLIYIDPWDSRVGRGARSYWSYETFLKRHESRASSLIGASGCLYAVRRSAYVPLYDEACSDFIICTKMVEQGLRAIYEPNAICTEETNRRSDNELKMRVRVIAQTFTDLWRHRAMLNPVRSGFYAVQLLSHKVMRYLVPFFLMALLATSVVLSSSAVFYRALLAAQVTGYFCVAMSWALEKIGVRSRLLALPQYFVLANLASLIAVYKTLRGQRYARWEPIRESARVKTST